MADFDELERLARAAYHDYALADIAVGGGMKATVSVPDAFIAAANPATILALLSANREMGESLRPFAALADMVGESWTDETPAFVGADGVTITIGQLRKARSALTTQRGDGE